MIAVLYCLVSITVAVAPTVSVYRAMAATTDHARLWRTAAVHATIGYAAAIALATYAWIRIPSAAPLVTCYAVFCLAIGLGAIAATVSAQDQERPGR